MYLNTIKAYFRLGRIHSAVLTGLAPVVTAAATGLSLSIYHYIELFLIGFLFHIFLFVYNEVRDINIDKASKDLKDKPLVDGSISETNAKIVVILSVALVFLFSITFFYEQSLFLIPLSLAALLFGALYDALGKRVPHADYFIATMLCLVALYGSFSVESTLNIFVCIIALLAFSQMLINNIIAGLKDVDHDHLAGGLSTPLRMKVRVENNKFIVSKQFIVYILVLKTFHIALTFIPFYYAMMPFEIWQFYLTVFVVIIAVVFMLRFLTMKIFDRAKLMRFIGFHEMFAFMVIPFLLYAFIGPVATIFLLFFPIFWLGIFLIFMYGKLMPGI